jgi:dienelactone hydrolase
MRRIVLAALSVLTLAAPLALASPKSFDPLVEAKNYAKVTERQAIYLTPQYQLLLRQIGMQNWRAAMSAQAADTDRLFADDLCWNGYDGCAGDVRLYDWQAKGYGIVTPVLFTARSGATLSGHVWATKAGPAKRPGIVITNGSVQADEQLYWFAAQALAKAGYVVLTFDPQGQGQSDTPGVGADQLEGVPAQKDGRPFFDGTEDALSFFLSTRGHPYVPVPSCNSGTSHADKQRTRVAAGLDTAYNPFASLLDPSRIGLAGHSYGASGVSYVAQADPRVKAVVAWDNLGAPDPSTKESGCVDARARKVVPITKPGLGMSADYFLPPYPNTSLPDPKAKSTESLHYSKAGVDTGEIIIRGGSHYDFDWIPNAGFGASLRGADEIAWYTTAWFDKYVKGDRTADARLLTNRWRHDGAEASVDLDHDGNLMSFYYDSRLDVEVSGHRVRCEDLRAGCSALSDRDGWRGMYDVLAVETSPDGHATTRVPSARGIYG